MVQDLGERDGQGSEYVGSEGLDRRRCGEEEDGELGPGPAPPRPPPKDQDQAGL